MATGRVPLAEMSARVQEAVLREQAAAEAQTEIPMQGPVAADMVPQWMAGPISIPAESVVRAAGVRSALV